MFVDEIKVFASAGHGGRGCVAFCREAYRPKGGPDGGNGGRGGSVILQADHDLNNLIGQFYVSRLVAENGQHGMGKGMDGHAGKDLIVKVPCGTLVWKLPDPLEDAVSPDDASATVPAETRKKSEQQEEPMLIPTSKRPLLRVAGDEMAEEIDLSAENDSWAVQIGPDDAELVADLTVHGQQFVLCKGGRGGLGNRNFATARNQTPRFAQPGEEGSEGSYRFELRMMADVGVVGYPNAGKSTLLTAISRARPKIAAYPFTTLTPQVGIVEYADFKRLTLCDVPGLIEGAHENVGLGHAFLRHITRCKILVILLDMAGTDGREPWNDYKQLLSELELYDPVLLDKPRLVVANKMDEPVAVANLKKFKRRVPRTPVLPISAAFDEGLPKFRDLIRKAVAEVSPP
ncbi:MAG: GTPase ObgE [Verrucomicrobia bacterium]|nr:GTPase ObgE [Verrucomicrobiota bacterium]